MAMEIVLQWLDDIDDLVSAGLFKSKVLRTLCLAMALTAAVTLPALLRLGVPSDAVIALLSISLAFLIAWAVVGSASARVGK